MSFFNNNPTLCRIKVVSAALIASPTPEMLEDYAVLYMDGTLPYRLYRSNGTSLVEIASGAGGGVALSGGASSQSTGTIIFSNANGITFGLNGGTMTASVVPGAAAGIGAMAAGTQTATSGTMVFSDSNGISFGMSGSTRITATVKTDYASSNHSHGNPTLNLTNLSGTTASNSAGMTLSLSAAAPAAGVAMSAAGNSVSAGTVVFSNSNGISFGMNGSTITATVTPGAAAGIAAAQAGAQTATSGTLNFVNSNGLTFGMSGSSQITASHNGLTTARASNDAIGLNTAQTNVTWTVNSSGLSLNAAGYAGTSTGFTGGASISGSMTHNSAGLAVSLSHPAWLTTAAASNHSHGNPTLNLTNLSGTTASNSAGLTLSLSAAAPGAVTLTNYATGNTTQSSSGTIAGSSVILRGSGGVSAGISNGSYVVEGPALTSLSATGALSASSNGSTISLGVGTVTASATGNTTQASSGTLNLNALIFQGTGGASVGISGGSVVISGGTGGGAGYTAGVSTGGNTSGDTGAVTGRLVLAGGNNITLSGSTNGGSMTLTISGANAGGAQTGISGIANSQTTYTSGSVTFSELGAITIRSTTGQQFQFSVPQTSSLSATGNASISTNGSTISIGANAAAISLSGNSTSAGAGYSNVSTGTLILAGGNNITLSQNGASVTISGANAGGAQTGISGVVVSDATYTSGTVTFQNANGISFGSSGANGVSASYTSPVVSNAIQPVGSATGSGTNTSRFAADDHVHEGVFSVGVSTGGNTVGDTRVGPGRFVLQGGNNVTLSQITAANALNTIVISGGAAGAADGINALVVNGGASTATTTLTLSNSNNVSFGHNAGVITATATFAQSNPAFSADASSTFQTLTFQDSNGVSFSNNAGALRVTHALQYTSNTSAITSNALHSSASRVINIVAATNNTGGGTASLSSNVSFTNANGATFYTSAGGAVALSYSVPAGGGAAISAGANSQNTGTVNFANSNGITFGLSNNGTMTASHNGLTTARASNDAIGLNTAQTNVTWTVNSSGLSLNAAGYAGTGTSITGGAAMTLNSNGLAFNGTGLAGTGTTFAGANISASITMNTAGINLSASVAAPGAAAENNNINLLGANTSGNTTASGSTIGLSGINMTLSGTNNSQVVLSVPATSSLVGASGVSISTNGSTITIYQQARSHWDNIVKGGYLTALGTAQGNSLVSIQPLYVEEPIVFSNALIPASFNVGSAANNSSAFMDVSASMVFYTRNGSSLSSVTSLGQTMTQTWSSNATGTVTGVIGMTLTGNNYTMTPGMYWAAVHISTTNTATGGANTTALTHAVTMLAARSVGSAAQLMKQWGAQSAVSMGVFPGQGILSTGATRASIALSDVTVTGTRAVVAPIVLQLRGATYQ